MGSLPGSPILHLAVADGFGVFESARDLSIMCSDTADQGFLAHLAVQGSAPSLAIHLSLLDRCWLIFHTQRGLRASVHQPAGEGHVLFLRRLHKAFVEMQGTAQRRIEMINGHFDVVAHPSSIQTHLGGPSFDVLALQRILEHDNFETRQKMKELMKQDLFVP